VGHAGGIQNHSVRDFILHSFVCTDQKTILSIALFRAMMHDLCTGAKEGAEAALITVIVWCILDKFLRDDYYSTSCIRLTVEEVQGSLPYTKSKLPALTEFDTKATVGIQKQLSALGIESFKISFQARNQGGIRRISTLTVDGL
jgi:hypothetical protein